MVEEEKAEFQPGGGNDNERSRLFWQNAAGYFGRGSPGRARKSDSRNRRSARGERDSGEPRRLWRRGMDRPCGQQPEQGEQRRIACNKSESAAPKGQGSGEVPSAPPTAPYCRPARRRESVPAHRQSGFGPRTRGLEAPRRRAEARWRRLESPEGRGGVPPLPMPGFLSGPETTRLDWMEKEEALPGAHRRGGAAGHRRARLVPFFPPCAPGGKPAAGGVCVRPLPGCIPHRRGCCPKWRQRRINMQRDIRQGEGGIAALLLHRDGEGHGHAS